MIASSTEINLASLEDKFWLGTTITILNDHRALACRTQSCHNLLLFLLLAGTLIGGVNQDFHEGCCLSWLLNTTAAFLSHAILDRWGPLRDGILNVILNVTRWLLHLQSLLALEIGRLARLGAPTAPKLSDLARFWCTTMRLDFPERRVGNAEAHAATATLKVSVLTTRYQLDIKRSLSLRSVHLQLVGH